MFPVRTFIEEQNIYLGIEHFYLNRPSIYFGIQLISPFLFYDWLIFTRWRLLQSDRLTKYRDIPNKLVFDLETSTGVITRHLHPSNVVLSPDLKCEDS